MSMFKRLCAHIAMRAAKYAGVPLRDPALVQMLGNQPTASGVDVDPAIAMNYSAVWQAVGIIASNVAAMPPTPYVDDLPAIRHPTYDVLTIEPNDEMTPYTFYETVTAHALTWGNGYAGIERGPKGEVVALDPLMPNQTTPERNNDGEVVYRFTACYPGEEDRVYRAHEVLHIAGLGYDGVKGYNVIENARESIGLAVAVEKYGAAFFGRGSSPGGMLQLPEGMEMSEKAKKNLRESFEAIHRGPDNAHRIAVLEDGITYGAIGLPLETAQFLQTRVFHIREIARWFNLPPHLLRDLEYATFSNIEHQGIDFLVYTLMPWLIRWRQEIRRKLFNVGERRTMALHNDTQTLLLTDIAARYAAYGEGRTGGWLTLNDILRREGKPLLPPGLGDSRLVPMNMRAVSAEGKDVFAEEQAEGDIQATAMNGIQVTSMQNIVLACSGGQMHPDTGHAMLKIAFPAVGDDEIENMLRPIREGFKSVPKDGGAAGDRGAPGGGEEA